MSDGNFNRALLPSTPYASGVKMGRQQMKMRSGAILSMLLEERFPGISNDEADSIVKEFLSRL